MSEITDDLTTVLCGGPSERIGLRIVDASVLERAKAEIEKLREALALSGDPILYASTARVLRVARDVRECAMPNFSVLTIPNFVMHDLRAALDSYESFKK